MAGEDAVDLSSHLGPRTVIIHRRDSDFGFTLRHFIVYPPESSVVHSSEDERKNENGDGNGGRSRPESSVHQEPMDTIFVKHVVSDGPADKAGLQVGDRIISVNGDCTVGKSYGQVLALIRASDSSLKLVVVPKHEDVIQMAYNSAAYDDVNIGYSPNSSQSESRVRSSGRSAISTVSQSSQPSRQSPLLSLRHRFQKEDSPSHIAYDNIARQSLSSLVYSNGPLHRTEAFLRHHNDENELQHHSVAGSVFLPTIGGGSDRFEEGRLLNSGRSNCEKTATKDGGSDATLVGYRKSPPPSVSDISLLAHRPQSLLTQVVQPAHNSHLQNRVKSSELWSPQSDSVLKEQQGIDQRNRQSPRFERLAVVAADSRVTANSALLSQQHANQSPLRSGDLSSSKNADGSVENLSQLSDSVNSNSQYSDSVDSRRRRRSLKDIDIKESWPRNDSFRASIKNTSKLPSKDNQDSVVVAECKKSSDSLNSTTYNSVTCSGQRTNTISPSSIEQSAVSTSNQSDGSHSSVDSGFVHRPHHSRKSLFSDDDGSYGLAVTCKLCAKRQSSSSSSTENTSVADVIVVKAISNSDSLKSYQSHKDLDRSDKITPCLSETPVGTSVQSKSIDRWGSSISELEELKNANSVVRRYSSESPTESGVRERKHNNRHSRIVDDGAYVPNKAAPSSPCFVKLNSDILSPVKTTEAGTMQQASPPIELEKLAIVSPVVLPMNAAVSLEATCFAVPAASVVRIEPSPKLEYNKESPPRILATDLAGSESTKSLNVVTESLPTKYSDWRKQQGTSVYANLSVTSANDFPASENVNATNSVGNNAVPNRMILSRENFRQLENVKSLELYTGDKNKCVQRNDDLERESLHWDMANRDRSPLTVSDHSPNSQSSLKGSHVNHHRNLISEQDAKKHRYRRSMEVGHNYDWKHTVADTEVSVMRNYSFLKATENQPMMTPFKPKSNHIDSNHFYPDKPSTSHIEYNYPYSDKPLTSRPLSYVDNSISSKPTDGHLSYSPNEASDLIPNDTNGFVLYHDARSTNMKKLKDFFGEQVLLSKKYVAEKELTHQLTPQLRQALDDRKFHYRINEASDDGSPVQTRRNELVRRSEILSWAGGMQDIHPDETSVPPVSIATAGSQDSTSFLEGPLMCKYTIADGKKASDRSWRQLWVEVKNKQLYLYKEKHGQLEDLPLPLTNCFVDVAHEYTKRKNVFRMTTMTGYEYYFQANDQLTMLNWIRVLQSFGHVPSDKELLALQQNRALEQKSLKSKSSIRSKSQLRKHAEKEVSETSPQSKERSWRGRVAKKFRRSLSTSGTAATIDTTDNSNVTFGVPLENCPSSGISTNIPFVVELCIKIVEQLGLTHVGVYRIPGNAAAVNMLKEELNKGIDAMDLDNEKWSDINVVSSLLKQFFQKLPEPLITEALYEPIISASRVEDSKQRLIEIRNVLHKLPRHNFETLGYLCKHLHRIVLHEEINKMGARNLAVVFGPTLVYTKDESMVSMVKDMSDQCRIVESIILHPDWFFTSSDQNNEVPSENIDIAPISTASNVLLGNVELSTAGGLSMTGMLSSLVSVAGKSRKSKGIGDDKNKSIDKHLIDSVAPASKLKERNIDEEWAKRQRGHNATQQPVDIDSKVNKYPAYIKYRDSEENNDRHHNFQVQNNLVDATHGSKNERGRPLLRGIKDQDESDDEIFVKPQQSSVHGKAQNRMDEWERKYILQKPDKQMVLTKKHIDYELQRAQRELDAERKYQYSGQFAKSRYQNLTNDKWLYGDRMLHDSGPGNLSSTGYSQMNNTVAQSVSNIHSYNSSSAIQSMPHKSQRDLIAEARRNFLTNPATAVAIPPRKDIHIDNKERVHLDVGRNITDKNRTGENAVPIDFKGTADQTDSVLRTSSLDSVHQSSSPTKNFNKQYSFSADDDDFVSSLTSAFDKKLELAHSPGSLLDSLSQGSLDTPEAFADNYDKEYADPSLHRQSRKFSSRRNGDYGHRSEVNLTRWKESQRAKIGRLSASFESLPGSCIHNDVLPSPELPNVLNATKNIRHKLVRNLQHSRRHTVVVNGGANSTKSKRQSSSAWERLQPAVMQGQPRDMSSWLAHMRLRKKTRSEPNLCDKDDVDFKESEDGEDDDGDDDGAKPANVHAVASNVHYSSYAELQQRIQSRLSVSDKKSARLRNFTFESSI